MLIHGTAELDQSIQIRQTENQYLQVHILQPVNY